MPTPTKATDSFWQNIEGRRRAWAPVEPEPNTFTSEYPETISRALCLRHLELPVKKFIQDGIDSSDSHKIGEEGIQSLIRNQTDEDKHDIALARCFNALKNFNPKYTLEASGIIQQWLDLDVNPITKVAVLENSVFFVILPIFNLYGFHPLRETSRDISRDELLHVQSHRKAAQLLGSKPTKALDQLRKDTVDWLTTDMDSEVKSGQRDKWMKSSDSLLKRGVSDMIDTKTVTQVAFFEVSNKHISKYA